MRPRPIAESASTVYSDSELPVCCEEKGQPWSKIQLRMFPILLLVSVLHLYWTDRWVRRMVPEMRAVLIWKLQGLDWP
jgi:hypothetical protein